MNGVIAYYGLIAKKKNAYDADAQAFFDKGVALGESELSFTTKNAVNAYIVGVKNAGLWTKLRLIRLYVGGTAVWHSINAKSPNSNIATFVNAPAHNSNGVTWDGISQYADENFNPTTEGVSLNSLGVGYYSRTASKAGGFDMGAVQSSGGYGIFLTLNTTNGYYGRVNEADTVGVGSTTANSQGMFTVNRTASNAKEFTRNGISVGTRTTASTSIVNRNIYSGALNNGGTAGGFSAINICFLCVNDGLTTAECLTHYNLIQTLQTKLGRQV